MLLRPSLSDSAGAHGSSAASGHRRPCGGHRAADVPERVCGTAVRRRGPAPARLAVPNRPQRDDQLSPAATPRSRGRRRGERASHCEDVVAQRALALDGYVKSYGRLPGRQREALVETALQGRGRSEIASAMGLSEGAVRQLVHRARMTLRSAARVGESPAPALVEREGGQALDGARTSTRYTLRCRHGSRLVASASLGGVDRATARARRFRSPVNPRFDPQRTIAGG